MPEHPILENAPLKIFLDEKEVPMIRFVYDIILNQNLELFTLLRRIPKKEEIHTFDLKIELKYNPEGKIVTAITESSMDPITHVSLSINEKRVGLKQFVQNVIFGINFGILQTLDGFHTKIKEITLKYKKQ
ncbi:MAG: hypothetical protein EU530_10085 [Promethearchaeota archaeon]|nr:MAG: hypothetical protein EU530_10085 [Candidatus Lokiarchaeota archaeon]